MAVVLLILLSTLGSLGNYGVRGEDLVELCRFDGPEVREWMELTDFVVHGYKELKVGDFVVVFFNLRYVAKTGSVTLEKVYLSVKTPDGTLREVEDKSLRGEVLNPGDSVRFHMEVDLDAKGTWQFWPSFRYVRGGEVFSSSEPWHECEVSVGEKPPTTTTTQALPDLTFDPSYTQPLGYSRCGGFYAHVANTGTLSIGGGTKAIFWVTSLATGTSWTLKASIPPLDPGEGTTLYSGTFVGVPGNQYRVKVILDSGNSLTEVSEFNNEREFTYTYTSGDLPTHDLEVSEVKVLRDGSVEFKVRHSGCLDSTVTTAHVGVEGGIDGNWYGEVIEINSQEVQALSGDAEITLRFDNVVQDIRNDPRTSVFREMKLHVWVDPVELAFEVEGSTVVIPEVSEANNIEVLVLGKAPTILGPNTYFLQLGQGTYRITDPESVWPAVSSNTVEGWEVTYDYSVEGCGASLTRTSGEPTELIISLGGECPERQVALTVRAETLGFTSEKLVIIYFYEISEPVVDTERLRNPCVGMSELGAEHPFIFTDIPVAVDFSPLHLLQPVLHTLSGEGGPIATSVSPSIEITVSWEGPGGHRVTYTVPEEFIEVSAGANPKILFTIPRGAVFTDLQTKAVSGEVRVELRLGSGQEVDLVFTDVWIHDATTFPVYLRSFHFGNTGCPTVTWEMWEDFWGEDAVWDRICAFGKCFKLWKDLASKALYDYVFTEMCKYGRCSSYALVSQKFAEEPPAVLATGRCFTSRPQPFTLTLSSLVRMAEEPPSRSFELDTMELNTYLTYQYMWSLDERNLRRGVNKFTRFMLGDDIVLETLNELRAWEALPDDVKWQDMYVIQMFDVRDITNSHTVLAYRVEEVNSSYARVWVVDSNRPFQPNNARNQDGSYIEFHCCREDGRWDYTFYIEEGGRKLDTFLFATPTSMLHGESAALTEGDVIEGLFDEYLEILRRMGAVSGNQSTESVAPALYVLGSEAGLKLVEVRGRDGGKLAYESGGINIDPESVSRVIVPVILPVPTQRPTYVLIADGILNLTVVPEGEGTVELVSESGPKSLSINFIGVPGGGNDISVAPHYVKVGSESLKGYTVISRLADPELPSEIVLTTSNDRASFTANFSIPGQVELRNLGDEDLVISVRFSRYGTEGVDSQEYTDLKVSPGDTAVMSPESWSNLEGGRLVLQVDVGSDGEVDYEKVIDSKTQEEEIVTETTEPTKTTEEGGTPTQTQLPIELPSKLTPEILGLLALILIAVITAVALTRRKK